MIKVDIISGFLGAGKTTVIKKLFEAAYQGQKLVLIENEFGEIGIDGGFLKESGVNIKEINSGCICCSLVGDFATSMKEVIETYQPERIVIEPSGVGKLSDIAKAVKDVEGVELNVLATVVDGPKCKVYMKNFGEFFDDQVRTADTIIISKTDKMANDVLNQTIELLKNQNDHANIITTSIFDLDSVQLLNLLEEKSSLKNKLLDELKEEHHHHEHHHEHEEECCCGHHKHEHHDHEEECCCGHHKHEHHEHEEECCCGQHKHEHHEHEEECCCGHDHEHHHEDECCCGHDHDHHHHHHAEEVFTSFGLETARPYTYLELDYILNALTDEEKFGVVLRAKGIVKAADNAKWYYFDYVSGDFEIRFGQPDYTGRFCVIGSKINTEEIEKLFNFRG